MTKHTVVVTFPEGPREVPAQYITRIWERDYHYVREPVPMEGWIFLEDMRGHWSAAKT